VIDSFLCVYPTWLIQQNVDCDWTLVFSDRENWSVNVDDDGAFDRWVDRVCQAIGIASHTVEPESVSKQAENDATHQRHPQELEEALLTRKAAIAKLWQEIDQLWQEIEQIQDEYWQQPKENGERIPKSFTFNCVHQWFELSYAQYLTLPRSIMQAMPNLWQEKIVALLEELDRTFAWRPNEGKQYRVTLHEVDYDAEGEEYWGERVDDPLANYRYAETEIENIRIKPKDAVQGHEMFVIF